MNAQMTTILSNPPTTAPPLSLESVRQRLRRLNLYGLLAQAEQILHEPWLAHVLEIEESERQRRSLRRRLDDARLGIFKPLADFDYDWPKELDRPLLDELMTLSFLSDAANVIIVGPNGLGKTMMAKNILHQAILRGHTARFTLASDMLHDLAAQDSSTQLPAGCAATRRRPCCAWTRSGIYPTTRVTPICCSRSSRAAINSAPRS